MRMIIATRILKLHRDKGDADVPVRIFSPEESGNSWGCRYEIDWPERQKTGTAYGADAIQALELALRMIGTDLYTSSYHTSGELFHEKPGSGYGVPVPNAIRDMLIGDDAKFQ